MAIINSEMEPFANLSSSFDRPSSSGPIPSIGERCPIKIKYFPLKPVASSIAITSDGDSTTQMVLSSLLPELQITHRSSSVSIRHSWQFFIFSTACDNDMDNVCAPSLSFSRR